MKQLPRNLYTAQSSRELDRIAIEELNIPGYTLMSRAGKAVFDLLQQEYSLMKRILVCCGAGNNAGDGYVVARLAAKAGFHVDVISMVESEKLQGDAKQASHDWRALGRQLLHYKPGVVENYDVIIDALLGTGLQRPLEGKWLDLVVEINQSPAPVIAVDVPSGLNADTGTPLGAAIEASHTLSFIGLKQGLFTHQARDYCGEILFDDLQVPADVYLKVPPDAHLLQWDEIRHLLQPRKHNSHKGQYGHVLVIGGDHGMAGAARMAAESALRCGAGMVTVITRPEHVGAMLTACPELMVMGCEADIPSSILAKASVIAIGPGLGQQAWGSRLLRQVLQTSLLKVLDADALNLLDVNDGPREDWILTPHPGEAGRLLEQPTADIQVDRFASATSLQELFGGTVVLKGSGTLIKSGAQQIALCPYGNPGMASAGMGDVLTGVIAGLLAQGLKQEEATSLGVIIHAMAGDRVAVDGQRGMLATDLLQHIRQLVNPDTL